MSCHRRSILVASLPRTIGRQFFEGAAVGVVTRIRFADPDQAFVGVHPHPHPVGSNSLDEQSGRKRTASILVIFMGPTASAAARAPAVSHGPRRRVPETACG